MPEQRDVTALTLTNEQCELVRAIIGEAYNLITQGESSMQLRQPSAQRIYETAYELLGEPCPLGAALPLDGDQWTRETFERAYGDAMQWRDWQTCERMIEERESESWWPAEKARIDAIPDPPGAGWKE